MVKRNVLHLLPLNLMAYLCSSPLEHVEEAGLPLPPCSVLALGLRKLILNVS